MTPSSGKRGGAAASARRVPQTADSAAGAPVLWAELLPWQLKERQRDCPVVYLPLGLCEPHGQVSAFGLDTIKAEYICAETARRAGGVVAPSLGYQIHESGYHARWLEDTVGEHNPHMTAMPPHVHLHFFLYQLRAFCNAGFRAIVVLSGHGGGNQEDLRQAANAFVKRVPVDIWVGTDAELVNGLYAGDHAGKFELSQLMHIRPDLVDMTKRPLADEPGAGGRLAIGDDAAEATPEHGALINEACVERLSGIVRYWRQSNAETWRSGASLPRLHYADIEAVWQEVAAVSSGWTTMSPHKGQSPVSPGSQWKPYEKPAGVPES